MKVLLFHNMNLLSNLVSLTLFSGDESEGDARVVGAVCALAGALARLCPGAALAHIIPKVYIFLLYVL